MSNRTANNLAIGNAAAICLLHGLVVVPCQGPFEGEHADGSKITPRADTKIPMLKQSYLDNVDHIYVRMPDAPEAPPQLCIARQSHGVLTFEIQDGSPPHPITVAASLVGPTLVGNWIDALRLAARKHRATEAK